MKEWCFRVKLSVEIDKFHSRWKNFSKTAQRNERSTAVLVQQTWLWKDMKWGENITYWRTVSIKVSFFWTRPGNKTFWFLSFVALTSDTQPPPCARLKLEGYHQSVHSWVFPLGGCSFSESWATKMWVFVQTVGWVTRCMSTESVPQELDDCVNGKVYLNEWRDDIAQCIYLKSGTTSY